MLYKKYAILSSTITVPVTLPARNPFRTSWRQTLDLRRVLMIVSTTFHRDSNRQITWVYVFPFGIRNRIVHPINLEIYLYCNMN